MPYTKVCNNTDKRMISVTSGNGICIFPDKKYLLQLPYNEDVTKYTGTPGY